MFLQVSLLSVLICLSDGTKNENEISHVGVADSPVNFSQAGFSGSLSLSKKYPTDSPRNEKEFFSKNNSLNKSPVKKKGKLIEKQSISNSSFSNNYVDTKNFVNVETSNSTHLSRLFESKLKNSSFVWSSKSSGVKRNGSDYFDQCIISEQETLKQLNDLYSLQNPQEEFKDEEKDEELFKAIYFSVIEYKRTWATRFFDKLLRKRIKRDEELVCFSKELGCFRDEGPFDYFDMLPNTPEEVNTQFILYTKENPSHGQYIRYENLTSITSSNFKSTRKSKFIIHGFGSSCQRVWVREMRDTLLKVEDVNVICVSWPAGASSPNYVRAASNTRLVGRQVAVLLEKLVKYANVNLKDVHLVGFSLGAHVSGFVGQRLDELRIEEQRTLKNQQRMDTPSLQGQRLGRITGLDPAGPFFESFPERMRLDKSDAEFVDVIHTNADSLIWGGLGAYNPLGHVDFYPNGGRVQKGCANLFVGGVTDILWPKEGDGRYLCNHRRGYKYFMESLLPVCKFPSFVCRDYETFLQGDCFPCSNCGNMGYYSDKAPGRGKLYLMTRDSEPFCANQYKVEIWHSGGPPTTESVSTKGYFYVTFVNQDGKNETIEVTRDKGKKMEAGSRTISIVVPHVALSNIINLQVQYKTHRGWISSGYNKWAIDKVSIMDSFGKIQSFCHRGLTMESGLTMLFPLVPGDCNPRELTLHPLPIPWPGIDYDKLSGFEHELTTPLPPPPIMKNKDHHGTSTTPRPPLKPSTKTPNTLNKNSGPSFTRTHSNNNQHIVLSIHPTRNDGSKNHSSALNVTKGLDMKDDQIDSMTQEEYVAWKDAPPPNLDPSQYPIHIERDSANRPIPVVIDKMNPVNIIPAPQLGKIHSGNENAAQKHNQFLKTNTVETKNITESLDNPFREGLQTSTVPKMVTVTIDPINKIHFPNIDGTLKYAVPNIREDAQVSITEIDFSEGMPHIKFEPHNMQSHGNLKESSILRVPPIKYFEDKFPGQIANHTLDIYANIYTGKEKGIIHDPTNSIIEGEIPFKERARAIKFDSSQNTQAIGANPQKPPRKISPNNRGAETTDFDRKPDQSFKGNKVLQSANQPNSNFARFPADGLRFQPHEGIPPNNFESLPPYTYPPTMLKPPKIVPLPYILPSQQPVKKEQSFLSKIISRFTKSDQKSKRQNSRPPNSYPNIRFENGFGGHEEPLTHASYLSPVRSPNVASAPQEDQPFFRSRRPLFRDKDPKNPFYSPKPFPPFVPSFSPIQTHSSLNFPSSRAQNVFLRAERRPDGVNQPLYVQILPRELGSFPHRRYNVPEEKRIRPQETENIPPHSNSRTERGRSLGPDLISSEGKEFPPFLVPFNNQPNAKYIPLRFSRNHGTVIRGTPRNFNA